MTKYRGQAVERRCPRPGCGRPFLAERDAPDATVCPRCEADAIRAAEREAREAKEAADRARLGLRPLTRATSLMRTSLAAAVHWCTWAQRFAADGELARLERAHRHLLAALELVGKGRG